MPLSYNFMPFCRPISQIRADFPALQQSINEQPLAYLDNAATSQKPNSVIDAMTNYYRSDHANVHRAAHQLARRATLAFESAREKVKEWVNARQVEEIIWTRGTTEAINLLAYGLASRCQPGDEIILSAMEHHANWLPWQQLAQRHNLTIRVIPTTKTGELDLEAAANLFNPRSRLLAVSHVSNVLGVVNPIVPLTQLAKNHDCLVIVDGAQACAHLAIDVQALDCDFYAFSAHKMLGPTGIGVLYGRYELLDAMPPWQTGGEMVRSVSQQGYQFQPPPLKFEAGTPAIAETIGLAAAIEYWQQLDRAAVQHHEQQLLQQAIDAAAAFHCLELLGPTDHRVGVAAFRCHDVQPSDIADLLDEQGVAVRAGFHCAMPLHQQFDCNGSLRLSVAPYNTQADIDAFKQALARSLDILGLR